MKKTLNLFSGIASVFALLAVLIACSAPKTEAASANVSTEIPNALRLHILANSDSEEDQRVKLLVRDAILNCVREHFDVSSKDDAIRRLHMLGSKIQDTAEQVLRENGFTYDVQLISGDFDFPDRTYGDEFYPAGDYSALRVILGDGLGHNWWCVMFPPLCVIDDGTGVERNDDGTLELKSLFADFIGGIFG